jgi:hypothetical protein
MAMSDDQNEPKAKEIWKRWEAITLFCFAVVGVIAAISTADASMIVAYLMFGLISVGGVKVFQSSQKGRAARAAAAISRLRAELERIGDPAIEMINVLTPSLDPKKVNNLNRPAVAALTRRHLVLSYYGRMSEVGRDTVSLQDIVSTSLTGTRLSLSLTSVESYRMIPDLRGSSQAIDMANFASEVREASTRQKAGGTASGSVADELAKLSKLRAEGALDDDEWDRAKDYFLGKDESQRDRAARELRQLHELHRSGVLSGSEFNTKKWDILVGTK